MLNNIMWLLAGIAIWQTWLMVAEGLNIVEFWGNTKAGDWLIAPLPMVVINVIALIVVPPYIMFRNVIHSVPASRFNNIDCYFHKLPLNIYYCYDKNASKWFKKIFFIRVDKTPTL